MTPVFFNYADARLPYTKRRFLKSSVFKLFVLEKKQIQRIDYVFCSDRFLLKLNQAHLQHDTLTDVITFDLSESNNKIAGEIYISVERVKENALIHKTSFASELQRVVFHGALHLCGYKDKTTKQKAQMRAKEDKYLKMFHVEQ
jgi:rRNA maturation RNase YbeY